VGAAAVEDWIGRLALDGLAEYRLRITAANVVHALSPANALFLNPGAMKAAIDTGGGSVVLGMRRFVSDMRTKPRLPKRSDPDSLRLGVDVAATPGAVVHRTPLLEVLQYRPSTPRVRSVPLLLVGSVVNKFYLTDISPRRSFAEYARDSGFQTFHVSWVNPDRSHRDAGLDAYVHGILDAVDVVAEVAGSEQVHLLGVCMGGMLTSLAAAYLAASAREDRLRTLSLLVAVFDYGNDPGPAGMIDRDATDAALRGLQRRGYVDGRDLGEALALLDTVDSVWWPWAHRYLLGADMPVLDLFYWLEDVTNLPVALVRDLVELTLENKLMRQGELTVLGAPLDFGRITSDSYIVAGLTDHLTPWQGCYDVTQLLGSKTRFVLVTGGHVQSLVRPPSSRPVVYRLADETPPEPEEFLRTAAVCEGSWWEDWVGWLVERSPEERAARKRLGSRRHPALDPAPGIYVRRRLDQS
jgi:polyhydroxyalkanoate synthase